MSEREGPEMISCEDAVERVYDFLDGELDAETMDRIGEHLALCRRCYPYFNFERIFLDHIRSKGWRGEANPELERKVIRLIRELDAEQV